MNDSFQSNYSISEREEDEAKPMRGSKPKRITESDSLDGLEDDQQQQTVAKVFTFSMHGFDQVRSEEVKKEQEEKSSQLLEEYSEELSQPSIELETPEISLSSIPSTPSPAAQNQTRNNTGFMRMIQHQRAKELQSGRMHSASSQRLITDDADQPAQAEPAVVSGLGNLASVLRQARQAKQQRQEEQKTPAESVPQVVSGLGNLASVLKQARQAKRQEEQKTSQRLVTENVQSEHRTLPPLVSGMSNLASVLRSERRHLEEAKRPHVEIQILTAQEDSILSFEVSPPVVQVEVPQGQPQSLGQILRAAREQRVREQAAQMLSAEGEGIALVHGRSRASVSDSSIPHFASGNSEENSRLPPALRNSVSVLERSDSSNSLDQANQGNPMFGGKLNLFLNAIKSKWVDPMQNQLTEAKYHEIAQKQTNSFLSSFGQQYPEIMKFIKIETRNTPLSNLWSKILLVTYCYNFFTCFWMLGFKGFPQGIWYYCEILAEVIMVGDWTMRLIFAFFFPAVWNEMQLLHLQNEKSPKWIAIRLLCCFPYSVILSAVLAKHPTTLISFKVACTRFLKLFCYRGFSEYFDPNQFSQNERNSAIFSLFGTLFSFVLMMHAVSMLFILPSRFQDGYGWVINAGYHNYKDVPNWQIYLDSLLYAVSNMSGMGWGSVYPVSNGEWFICILLFTLGCTVYLKFYADLRHQIQMANQKFMENFQRREQCKIYGQVRKLPDKIRRKTDFYFKNYRMPFEELKERRKILKDLPDSLQAELSYVISQNLVEAVGFFQASPRDFVMKITRFLKPQIIIRNGHVFHKERDATKMYFINEGVVEIVANDEKTLIRFLSKGDYFGEIGCLLTNKRTCSAIVRTTTLLYSIRKEPLLQALDEYPEQMTVLKDVATQRLRVTRKQEVARSPTEKELIESQIKQLKNTYTVFGKPSIDDKTHCTTLLHTEFTNNMTQLNRLKADASNSNQSHPFAEKANTNAFDFDDFQDGGDLETFQTIRHVGNKKPKIWQTTDTRTQDFLIIPFSTLFFVWNAILFLVVAYDSFMVLFSIAFDFKVEGEFMIADIACMVLLAADIFMRAKTAITTPNHLSHSSDTVLSHYLSTWFLMDVFAAFPLCYILKIASTPDWVVQLARLPRLLKIFRLVEVFQIFEYNTNVRIEIYRIIELFLLYGFSGHLIACIFAFIGQRENSNTSRFSSRFDGQTLFSFSERRPWQAGIIDDFSAMSKWQLYSIMLYLGIGIQGKCPYGDIVPWTPIEEIFALLSQIWACVLIAMINSECASLLNSIHIAKANQVGRRDQNCNWMAHNQVSTKVIQRYKEYEDLMWESFKGIDEEEVLKSLPSNLRYEIRSHILKKMIANWEAFANESIGRIDTVVSQLKIAVYPRFEHVFRPGEIAEELYFIVDGSIEIVSADNKVLGVLRKGQSFGESALVNPQHKTRTKKAQTQTMVTLAILGKKEFDNIVRQYPQLKINIEAMVNRRRFRTSLGLQVGHSADTTPKLQRSKPISLNVSQNFSPANLSIKSSLSADSSVGSVSSDDLGQPPIFLQQLEDNQRQGEINSETSRSLGGDQKTNQLLQRRKTSKKRSSVLVYFEQNKEEDDEDHRDRIINRLQQFIYLVVLLLSTYNLVFTPLQLGFRIKYKKSILGMEIATIFFYLAEVALRVFKIRALNLLKTTPMISITKWKERKLVGNPDLLEQKIGKHKRQIILTLIAVLPLSWVITITGMHEPLMVNVWLHSIRLIKITPIVKFWRWTQRYYPNIMTLLEIIFYYYMICHWFSGVMLAMAVFKTDHRDSWLRRLPSPSQNAIRTTPNVFDDLSAVQVFNYAFYFQVNTFSNLTVGDVTSITIPEKLVTIANIWLGTFIYNFCFANITTVVALISSGKQIEFFSNYNSVLAKIKSSKASTSIVGRVKQFFDYVWDRHRGVSFDELRTFMPPSMASDLSISLFRSAIDRSLLFCTDEGDIDIPLAVSIMKQLEFKQFLAGDFIVKVGQHTTDSYILLEGELKVYGFHQNMLLGVLTQGSHVGLDLSDTWDDRRNILQFNEMVKVQFEMDSPQDNFDNRSIIHVVAKSIVTVGIITQKQREVLYKAFPEFKKRMQFMNRVLFMLGKVSLERHTVDSGFENNKFFCSNQLLSNISHSTKETYQKILEASQDSPQNLFDLHLFIKQATVTQSMSREVYQTDWFRIRVLQTSIKSSKVQTKDFLKKDKGLKKLQVHRDSKMVQTVKMVQFFNILYIALTIPLVLAFRVKQDFLLTLLEVFSLLISTAYVAVKLLTTIVDQGDKSLKLSEQLRRYLNEGLIVDLFGLLPLNLILGFTSPLDKIEQARKIVLIAGLRFARVFNIIRGFSLAEEFTVYLTSASYYIILIKAITIWFIQIHLLSCVWYFFSSLGETNFDLTWTLQQELATLTFSEKYLRCYYFTLNIATGIGTGDMVPQNELERLGITLMMLLGDTTLPVGFGLLIYFWGLSRTINEKADVEEKIKQIQHLDQNATTTLESKQRMTRFFAYQYYKSQSTNFFGDLGSSLPLSVVQELTVQTNQEIFRQIFKDLNSENLIRELCLAIKGHIYLPEDFIINKGDTSDDIFFIVDGNIHLILSDKKTIAMTLEKGEHFGELEVLKGTRRVAYAQSATFSMVNSMSKESLNQIASVFPQLLQQIQKAANEKQDKLEKHELLIAQQKPPQVMATHRTHSRRPSNQSQSPNSVIEPANERPANPLAGFFASNL